jgi:Spy/CpxP family protein refolding chaperone
MFHALLMGAVGGALAAKLVLHRRAGGGCGHRARFGWRARRGVDPRRIFRLMRELDLSSSQRAAFEEILADLREQAGGLRDGGREAFAAIATVLGRAEFDRAAVEAEANRHTEPLGRAKEKLVDALERAHAILIPEQREKLRRLIADLRPDEPGGPDDGPYRASR